MCLIEFSTMEESFQAIATLHNFEILGRLYYFNFFNFSFILILKIDYLLVNLNCIF